MKVEIRYLVDKANGSLIELGSNLKNVDDMVTPVGVEKAFKVWLEEKVGGRNHSIRPGDQVNGIFYILEREEENKLFQMVVLAAGK